jgi:hypothetical protein
MDSSVLTGQLFEEVIRAQIGSNPEFDNVNEGFTLVASLKIPKVLGAQFGCVSIR